MSKPNYKKYLARLPETYDKWILALLAVIFFMPLLGGVHLFDWDEINFAECAREMLVLGDYLRVHIDFQPFWEKPPVFFWLQVLSMKLWGINEYAARFPNAVCGMLTLWSLYFMGKRLYDRAFGYLWVLAYLGSILPHLYFKSGIIDPWFNFFIFWGLYCFIRFYWVHTEVQKGVRLRRPFAWLVLAGVCTGLAVLTKGPVAALVTGLVLGTYWLWQKGQWYLPFWHFVVYGLVAVATASLWFGVEILQNGTWFVEEFTRYQIRLLQTHDAGHRGFMGYHFVVLFFGVFPASIFAIRSFWQKNTDTAPFEQTDFRRWMLLLFWVVLILFSLVQSKIVHYSSLCYYPLTFLAAIRLKDLLNGAIMTRFERIALVVVGSLVGLVLWVLPYLGQHIEIVQSWVQNDLYTWSNLQADVRWSWYHWIPAVVWSLTLLAFFGGWKKEAKVKRLLTLFIGMAVFVNIALIFFINNIERYSQGAVIDFYKERQGEDCYVYPTFRTYADMFYTRKMPPANDLSYGKKWLMQGNIDKDVYFVTKIHHLDRIDQQADLQELYRKNGFVFLKREKK